MKKPESIKKMERDLRSEERLIRVKRQIVRTLARLPDDDSRLRAVVAAGVLAGAIDPRRIVMNDRDPPRLRGRRRHARCSVPLRHLVVTGQTQESGKTTTRRSRPLVDRSGLRAIALRKGDSRVNKTRVAIIFDGHLWYVRRIRVIEHDLDRDEKVYRCDQPIANNLPTLTASARVAERFLGGDVPDVGYKDAVAAFRRELITNTLRAHGWNRTHAAAALGLQRTYLLRLIREIGIQVPARTAGKVSNPRTEVKAS